MREVDLKEAIEVLRRGQILAYPTETFYGLGVDISQPSAVENLFRIKGRGAEKAVSLLVAGQGTFEALVLKIWPKLLKIMDNFLPGPLTIVTRASDQVPESLQSEGGWVGLRMSSHPMAQALAAGLAAPLTTTSANLSGAPSASSLAELQGYFGDREDIFLLSGGDLPPSSGSTVIRVDENRLELLRAGDIPFADIENTFGVSQP